MTEEEMDGPVILGAGPVGFIQARQRSAMVFPCLEPSPRGVAGLTHMRTFPQHRLPPSRLWLVLLAVLVVAVCVGPGSAQNAPRDGDIFYTSNLSFNIPFDPLPADTNVVRVRLHYSIDGGLTWRPGAEARPTDRTFPFRAEREGLYFFATQTQDNLGRFFPPDLRQVAPSLKVRIITSNPSIYLRQIAPREGCSAAVMWNIPEDGTDPNSVQVDYRTVSTTTWTPLPEAPRLLNGSYHWNPTLPGPLEVRVRVRDKVSHVGEQILMLEGSGTNRPGVRTSDSAFDDVKFVGSLDLTFKYNVEEVGPSGVKEVEVWMTEDKETWSKVMTEPNAKAPITYHVPHEGRFGFRLVAVSGVGKSIGRPTRGSPPSFWVEVDTTAPSVDLATPEVGGTFNSRQVTINWKATDKNLAPNPVKLLYAVDRNGPWNVIAENRPAQGLHIWQVNNDLPARVYIRVEAVDRAGNKGQAETLNEVVIDLAQPRVNIEQVGPAPKDMPRDRP
jgi:hypothetical protein